MVSDLYDSILTISFDDKGETTFDVHRGLISYHSSYFRGALKAGPRNGKKKTLVLPAADKEPFRVFMRWMYTLRLHEPEVAFSMKTGSQTEDIVEAYIFGEKRGIPGLKNAITDMLIEACIKDNIIPCESLQKIWSSTAAEDGLRKLFLDWLTYYSLKEKWFSDHERYPAEFLCQLLNRVIHPKRRPSFRSNTQWREAKCTYHDHAFTGTDDEPTPPTPPLPTPELPTPQTT